MVYLTHSCGDLSYQKSSAISKSSIAFDISQNKREPLTVRRGGEKGRREREEIISVDMQTDLKGGLK